MSSNTISVLACKSNTLESVQDFLIKLDMKTCMHLVETSIFSLNHVIVRSWTDSKVPKSVGASQVLIAVELALMLFLYRRLRSPYEKL